MKGICLQCGFEFNNRRGLDKRKKNPQQLFCSRECAKTYRHEHNPVCPMCGRRHIGDADDPCCDCKKKIKYEASLHKHCEICGAEFIGRSARCSSECNKEYARRRAKDYDNALFVELTKPRGCKWCGNKFIPEYGSKKRMYCSDTCAYKATKQYSKISHRMRNNLTLIKSDSGYRFDPISIKRLHKRDNGRCSICGKNVDLSLPRIGVNGPHPWSASRDHIVPLACGGKHTWENIRLAHFECNRKRGTGGNAQLLLFG